MAMSLEEFCGLVRVLDGRSAGAARRRFVEAFVGSASAPPPIWAAIRDRRRVSLARLWATVADRDVVSVMWDPPRPGRGRRPEGAFGSDDVLECRVVDLEGGIEWLPDDLYVFDDSFTWSAIFTHESDVDGGVQLLARAVALPARDVAV